MLFCFLCQSSNFGEVSIIESAQINCCLTIGLVYIEKLTMVTQSANIFQTVLLGKPECSMLCHDLVVKRNHWPHGISDVKPCQQRNESG